MEKVKADLVIVYDKYTGEMANGISGKLAGTYTCLVQSDKLFESKKKEFNYTNNNKILFLSNDSIEQYLSMSKVTHFAIEADYFGGPEKYKIYAKLYSLGNWRGIKVDIERTINALPKIERRGYKIDRCCEFVFFPIMFTKFRPSKLIEDLTYESAVEFFLKEENLKLIISD